MKTNKKAQQTKPGRINCCSTYDCPTSNQKGKAAETKTDIIKSSLPEPFEKL